MFMIFVGLHARGAVRREREPAADVEGIELGNGDDGGGVRRRCEGR